ncbi:hypothetical protein Y032_0169g214 [Ancylostoma ceylanicum]|uniref:ZP domain-containing protein n=1 Tax=Ancylostoma ceylanicum TaxID=53326 RepID=A0A016SW62_9BILA|nr:hypothetical protein Y032_0169g214 [Ancylostoma ceylanicum]
MKKLTESLDSCLPRCAASKYDGFPAAHYQTQRFSNTLPKFTKSRRVHFNCMLSVCHKNDADCMKEIPPRCSRSLRKRQLPGDISVEERLKHLHALMEAQNYTGDDRFVDDDGSVVVDGEAGTVTANIAARPLVVDDGPEPSSQPCLPSNYLHWIYVLLITNILSILVAVVACSNLLKRRFSIDVTTFEHKYHSPM